MDIKLRITITILLLLSLIYIFPVIKNKKLSMKYGVFWTLVFLIFIIMLIFPNMLTSIATFLGFEKVSNMLFLFGYFALMYFVFALYLTVTKLNNENRKLIQELSLLKYKCERDDKK
mgnify:CR=1 FL=1